jgi:hypothetical protein
MQRQTVIIRLSLKQQDLRPDIRSNGKILMTEYNNDFRFRRLSAIQTAGKIRSCSTPIK